MKNISMIVAVIGLAWGGSAAAQGRSGNPQIQYGSGDSNTVTDVGRTTHQDLEMQRSGRASVPPQPMSRSVATRVYKRYLKSFTYDIPEQFEQSSFGTGTRGVNN